ncbi:hypothetical protein ACFLTX_00190 [Chloroflexota bacterium]
MLKNKRTLPFLILITLIAIGILTFFGPQEESLGSNVRLVYLHGAWVLTAEMAFIAAGLIGTIALLFKKLRFHTWSEALGQTGILFWITYLPMSLWAMQANWNGLFLAEPRFRLAMIFAVTGLLLQIGLWIMQVQWLTSLANIAFIITLRLVFATAANIMHPPPSPIFNSGNIILIAFFVLLNLLTWFAAVLVARWLLLVTSRKPN